MASTGDPAAASPCAGWLRDIATDRCSTWSADRVSQVSPRARATAEAGDGAATPGMGRGRARSTGLGGAGAGRMPTEYSAGGEVIVDDMKRRGGWGKFPESLMVRLPAGTLKRLRAVLRQTETEASLTRGLILTAVARREEAMTLAQEIQEARSIMELVEKRES